MVIKNKSKDIILSDNTIEAKTFMQKNFGLILHQTPITMIFHTRFGIHTFFMSYPIDVLVLDKKGKVVKFKKNLLANKIFLWNPKYNTVIELPKNTLDKTQTSINDVIIFD
jgi:uncharacterized protein